MLRHCARLPSGQGLLKVPRCVSALCTTVPLKHASTASTEAKPDRLTRNMSFRSAYDSPLRQEERPLVLIYSWLLAKSKHLHKYGDFYLKKGYDVLHIKLEPTQLMWPRRVQRVTDEVLDFAQEAPRRSQPILVHMFSVGGYMFSEALVKMEEQPDTYGSVGERLQGLIYDSPVDFYGIPRGVSMAATPNRILQKVLEGSLHTYLRAFRRQTEKHYTRAQDCALANNFRVPSLLLYSRTDPIADPRFIKDVVSRWRQKDIEVHTQCFDNSKHVSHFLQYPVEYINAMNEFLRQIGLWTEPAVQERITMTA